MNKMVIGIRGGHSPNCAGANGFLNEQAEVRKISYKLIKILKQKGYTIIDCNSNSGTVDEELNEGTYKARNCDIYLPIHMNASNGKGHGVECWCYDSGSTKAVEIGNNINKNLSSLGLTNRGVKFSARLHDTRSIKGQTCLVELLFCDNKEDSDIYNKTGINKIVDILGRSIEGIVISDPISSAIKPAAPLKPQKLTINTNSEWIKELQEECNKQGFSKQKVDGIYGINTLNGCPTLKQGIRGNITRLLQEKLNSLTYNTNGIDGIYGSTTHNAVFNYQKNHGLSADGICGKNTWREIIRQKHIQ